MASETGSTSTHCESSSPLYYAAEEQLQDCVRWCHNDEVLSSYCELNRRVNTSEHPFTCQYCGNKFVTIGGMQRHITVKHWKPLQRNGTLPAHANPL